MKKWLIALIIVSGIIFIPLFVMFLMILFPPVISDYDDVFTNETNVTNVTINETNLTINETNLTINETNLTINETNLTINETNVTINETNVTINETNLTKTKRRRSNNDDDDDEERQRNAAEERERKRQEAANLTPNEIEEDRPDLLPGNIDDDYCWAVKTLCYFSETQYCTTPDKYCVKNGETWSPSTCSDAEHERSRTKTCIKI